MLSRRFSEKFHVDFCQTFLCLYHRVQISLPYRRMGTASALYTFSLKDFCTQCGLKVLFRFPVVLDLLNLTSIDDWHMLLWSVFRIYFATQGSPCVTQWELRILQIFLSFPYFPKRPFVTPVIAGDPRQSQCITFVIWKFSACRAGALTDFIICAFVRYCRVSPKFLRHVLTNP